MRLIFSRDWNFSAIAGISVVSTLWNKKIRRFWWGLCKRVRGSQSAVQTMWTLATLKIQFVFRFPLATPTAHLNIISPLPETLKILKILKTPHLNLFTPLPKTLKIWNIFKILKTPHLHLISPLPKTSPKSHGRGCSSSWHLLIVLRLNVDQRQFHAKTAEILVNYFLPQWSPRSHWQARCGHLPDEDRNIRIAAMVTNIMILEQSCYRCGRILTLSWSQKHKISKTLKVFKIFKLSKIFKTVKILKTLTATALHQ